jgi:type I restriction enzyme, R subunit
MPLHKEISFETEICEHLPTQGWLYTDGDAKEYDRAGALFPADVLAWVHAAQPKAREALGEVGAKPNTISAEDRQKSKF